VQPVSFVLLVAGYPVFLVTLSRWTEIVRVQARLAALAHQISGWVVVAGWLVAARPWFVAIHAAWLVAARVWFAAGYRRAGGAARPISR
jgi:hypothetical protein